MRNSARLLFVIAAVISCGGEPTAPRDGRVDLTAEWETADPASLGMDPVTLTAALDHGETLPRLLSLVVVRRGRIVAEQYYHGNHVDSLNDVRSVTKTVVATITGIVAREGKLHEDSTIGTRLSAWAPGMDAAHRAITIASLLSMSAGFQWNESSTAGYNAWITSSDPIAYVLERPLANQQGTTFTYNSGAVHVLSVLVEKYAGRRIDQIAAEKLWPRLGIQKVRWEIFPSDGRPNGGAGLDLRPRDMAKLGWLWLEEGRGRDGPVIDEGWVEKGTGPAFSWWQAVAPFNEQNYGWLWWLYRKDGRTAFYAWGHGGQFIWVDPSLELVVVVTNNWRNVSAADASESARTGMDLIINHVLPAIR